MLKTILGKWSVGLIVVLLVLALLFLDFLALDDITTGNEPSYFGEYLILMISILLLLLFYLLWKRNP